MAAAGARRLLRGALLLAWWRLGLRPRAVQGTAIEGDGVITPAAPQNANRTAPYASRLEAMTAIQQHLFGDAELWATWTRTHVPPSIIKPDGTAGPVRVETSVMIQKITIDTPTQVRPTDQGSGQWSLLRLRLDSCGAAMRPQRNGCGANDQGRAF